ncbi:MAG: 30S ribosomal protein S12 methylthiotransferase RimO [Deltaproteobacteria bacterium]|nr:30S ribosomal protein S12 methylthiotransferase RimO [Deltaproteobacteria bacterium]
MNKKNTNNTKLKTVYFLSLGCPKNRVDTDVMAASLIDKGMKLVFEPEIADVIVVNTCSFIGDAKEESIDALLEMAEYKKNGTCKKLVAAGCLPQRYGKELGESITEIDLLTGTSSPDRLPELINETFKDTSMLKGSHFLQKDNTPRLITKGQKSVYVKISDGCSRKCAFCAIPGIRGKSESRSIENIKNEITLLAQSGAVEINLVSQDTAQYGKDLKDGTTLEKLLKELNTIDKIKWIRILYLYPDSISDSLLKTIDKIDKVVPYLDIPIQHAADNMLKAMRRGHTKKDISNTLKRVRSFVKNPFLRTTVMVGFPGETENDAGELVSFITESSFNNLGAFRYSDEEGTPAVNMKPKVSKKESYNRWRKVMAAQKKVARAENRKLIGTVLPVLIEDTADESGYILIGRHLGQAPDIDGITYVTGSNAKIGDIINCKITDFKDYDLVAEEVS